MGILSRLFGKGPGREHEALLLLKRVDRFLEENGPSLTVQFMASAEFKELERAYWPRDVVGPGGPLHSDLVALLRKVKARGDAEIGRNSEPTPTPEEAMRRTGMSEHELTRRFMEHLIQEGKNPFEEMPAAMLREAEREFPDLVELAGRRFGGQR